MVMPPSKQPMLQNQAARVLLVNVKLGVSSLPAPQRRRQLQNEPLERMVRRAPDPQLLMGGAEPSPCGCTFTFLQFSSGLLDPISELEEEALPSLQRPPQQLYA